MLSYSSSEVDFCTASEDEVRRYCKGAPHLSSNVRILSEQVVVKLGFGSSDHEYRNQEHAWKLLNGTTLRVPKPLRFFSNRGSDNVETSYLLMERVKGCTLEERYRIDDIIGKVVDAIRYMQNQTRMVDHRPGPIAGGSAQGFPWGGYGAESEFQCLADVDRCANRRLSAVKSGGTLTLQGQACVLFHGDLVPRNILVTEKEEIVFLDWETACYYPPILEVAALYFHPSVALSRNRSFFDEVVVKLLNHIGEEENNMKKLERVHVVSLHRYFQATP